MPAFEGGKGATGRQIPHPNAPVLRGRHELLEAGMEAQLADQRAMHAPEVVCAKGSLTVPHPHRVISGAGREEGRDRVVPESKDWRCVGLDAGRRRVLVLLHMHISKMKAVHFPNISSPLAGCQEKIVQIKV